MEWPIVEISAQNHKQTCQLFRIKVDATFPNAPKETNNFDSNAAIRYVLIFHSKIFMVSYFNVNFQAH